MNIRISILTLTVVGLSVTGTSLGQDLGRMAEADALSIPAADLVDQGRFREAEAPLRAALEIDLEIFGPNHIQTAHTIHDLAWVLWYVGKLKEAEELFGRVEAVYVEVLGIDPATGLRFDGTATFYQGPPVPKRMRMSRQWSLGNLELDRARGLNNVGWVFGRTGAYAEAWDALDEALALEVEFSKDPVEIAVSHHNQLLLGWLDLTHEDTWSYRAELAVPLIQANRSLRSVPLEIAHMGMLAGVQPSEKALATLERQLELARSTFGGDYWRIAFLRRSQGLTTQEASGASFRVLEHLEEAVRILEANFGRNHPTLAEPVNGLGRIQTALGHWEEAGAAFKRARSLVETTSSLDHPDLRLILANESRLYVLQGRLDEAVRGFLNVAPTFEADNPMRMTDFMAAAAEGIALQGRLAEAEILARDAMNRWEAAAKWVTNREAANPPSLSASYMALAKVYARQGRPREAKEILDRVIAASQEIFGEESWGAEQGLATMASVYLDMGSLEAAGELASLVLDLRKRRLHSDPNHPDIAHSLTTLANVYRAQEQYAEAEARYLESIQLLEESLGAKHALVGSGLVDLTGNRVDSGTASAADLELLDRAIDILSGSGGHPASRVEALALRAQLARASGDKRGSLDDMEEALEILDEMRPNVGGGEETRAGFFGRYAGYYDDIVSWMVEEGDLESAFEYAERGRARVMLDQLASGKVDLRSKIPAAERAAIEERETRARARMAEYEYRITLLRSRTDMSEQLKLEQLGALEDSLRSASRDFQTVYEEIKNASSLWRDQLTTGGQPVRLGVLHRSVIPDDGLLISYQIGRDHSLLFLIGKDRGDISAVPLVVSPSAAEVLGVGEGPFTIESLRASLTPEGGTGILEDLMTRSRVAGMGTGRSSTKQLHALWSILIPEAIQDRVLSASEVILAPDDALNSLPFEALVVSPGASPLETQYWLDAGPPIRYTASATVLYNLESRTSARVRMGAPDLLSVADPMYDLSEVRAGEEAAESGSPTEPEERTQSQGSASLDDLNRNSYTRAGGTLVRLPGTKAESDEVLRVMSGAQGEAVALQGLDATEANIRSAVGGKQYVHLATHGLVGGPRGALFASLALTPPADGVRDPGDDGYLQLHEIYGLPLEEAELAVLSACETNVGKAIDGEGVFALSRGFLAAGARRVVASQWAVDDASTARLMGAFFSEVALAEQGQSGVDMAASLANAKKTVRADERWSDPFYWAPFVLAGKR